MSQALFVHAARDLRLGNALVEDPKAHEVRIDLRRGGICGSDLHYFNNGGFGAITLKEPMILGHEVAGEIVALGSSVEGLVVGDLLQYPHHALAEIVLSVCADFQTTA